MIVPPFVHEKVLQYPRFVRLAPIIKLTFVDGIHLTRSSVISRNMARSDPTINTQMKKRVVKSMKEL